VQGLDHGNPSQTGDPVEIYRLDTHVDAYAERVADPGAVPGASNLRLGRAGTRPINAEVNVTKERAPRKESYSVASKIKEFVRSKGYCAGSDLPDAVSDKVVELLSRAIERTESNGRKTVRAEDL